MSFATLVLGVIMRATVYPVLAVCVGLMLMGLLNGLFSVAEAQVGASNPLTAVWWLVVHRDIAGGAIPADMPIFALDFAVAGIGAVLAAIISRISRMIPEV